MLWLGSGLSNNYYNTHYVRKKLLAANASLLINHMSNIVILKPKFEGQAAVVKVVLGYVDTLGKVITWLGISVKKEKLHNTLEANIFQDLRSFLYFLPRTWTHHNRSFPKLLNFQKVMNNIKFNNSKTTYYNRIQV